MESKERGISVLMLPWLGHSHVSSYLQLGKRLAKRGFSVTLCSTQVNLTSVKQTLEHLIQVIREEKSTVQAGSGSIGLSACIQLYQRIVELQASTPVWFHVTSTSKVSTSTGTIPSSIATTKSSLSVRASSSSCCVSFSCGCHLSRLG